MELFWLEYMHFIASVFAILVSIAAFSLFLLTYRVEQQLTTVWRAVGFIGLAVTFFLFIMERKYPGVGFLALVIETLSFYSIYKGVLAEPKLSKLRNVGQSKKDNSLSTAEALKKAVQGDGENRKSGRKWWDGLTIPVLLIIFAFLALPILTFLGAFQPFIPSIFVFASLIFIALTIRLQIIRYRNEKGGSETKRQNLWPLIGYVFLLLRAVVEVVFRLPELDIVLLRDLTLDFSTSWQLTILYAFLGFLFLGIWAWNFIKVRVFLRTYVVFLALAILVSSLGSLIFTLLIFTIVEKNNLDLMEQGASAEELILNDRANTALFISRTISEDEDVVVNMQEGDIGTLTQVTQEYLETSGVDILRLYNASGEVVVSPSEIRDQGDLVTDDSLLDNVLLEMKHVKAFETDPAVLTDNIVTRAINPIIVGNELVGAVEVGYFFDNAFVDFSKERINLDVTIFTGSERSATTIKTEDNVSRWVGSSETNAEVTEKVLDNGETYSTLTNRLGRIYYSAFKPIRNVDDEVIGMVAVGSPSNILFENTRQQLITTFLIVTLISLLTAGIGYYAIQSFRKVKIS